MAAYIHDAVRNEEARLNALRDLNLLDTSPSDSFDRLTRLASKLLDAPVSTISLTDRDRQWFKSKVGVDISEIPREQAPCSYAIGDNGTRGSLAVRWRRRVSGSMQERHSLPDKGMVLAPCASWTTRYANSTRRVGRCSTTLRAW
jgi:hypothetical protein